jgi:hypothetical protein
LDTPGLESGQRIAGPQPGWAYVRCFKCTSFAAINLSNARTVVVNEKATKKVATPPPFKHQAPAPQVQTSSAPDALERFLAKDTVTEAAPFPAPLPELEEQVHAPNLTSTFDQTLETEIPPPYIPHRGSNQLRAVLAIGAVMTALAVTASYATDWLAQSRAPAQAVVPAAHLKRAQAAAKRMEAPALSSDTPIPAAPLGAALTARAPIPAPREVRDSIQSSAMAPTRPKHDEPAPLFLQARKHVRTMELRTGPGPGFPLLGYADLEERYPVVEWKDRWFKIQLEETPGLTAWVAYERIELFSQDKNIEEEVWR